MSVRNYIQNSPTVSEETVTFGEDKFFLSGSTDLDALTHNLMMPQTEVELNARHWSKTTNSNVSQDNVRHIAVVHAAL